jgi:hypothetical protein
MVYGMSRATDRCAFGDSPAPGAGSEGMAGCPGVSTAALERCNGTKLQRHINLQWCRYSGFS